MFLRHRLYFAVRSLLPWRARIPFRRLIANHKRIKHKGDWPIQPSAATAPEGWKGWPKQREFAFVLTHDVESQRGLDRVKSLAKLEIKHGVRSSFNFIPEGPYQVPDDLIKWLKENNFEIGVHDLHHDGKLFNSKQKFINSSKKINHYLREWDAVGYRSGFMLRNLDWYHYLNIEYDSSTFDTDPFEPQSDGVNTIFPYQIDSYEPNSKSSTGYIELPYTLPQDSTLFLLFKEKGIEIWKQKLDWIASNNGMALLNVHPDYVSFDSSTHSSREFSHELYRQFLSYVTSNYKNQFWHALPKEVATFMKASPKKDPTSTI